MLSEVETCLIITSMDRLYFGDNLGWLRNTKDVPDASADLVYLAPPFNSNVD